MYFQNCGLRNTWRNKCRKTPVSEETSTKNTVRERSTAVIWTTPPLSYLLITVEAIEFEKISLSDMQTLRNVCEHIDYR